MTKQYFEKADVTPTKDEVWENVKKLMEEKFLIHGQSFR